jgi:hypothetical protein
MASGVLVRDDRRARGVQPLVAVCVIEMPVCVDELLDGSRADSLQGGSDLRLRHREAGVHHELPVAPSQDADVAAGAFEHVDTAAHGANRDRALGRLAARGRDDAGVLGVQPAWRGPQGGAGDTERRYEATTRSIDGFGRGAGVSLHAHGRVPLRCDVVARRHDNDRRMGGS